MVVAYRMTNGRIIHPECREAYCRHEPFRHEPGPTIQAGLMAGYEFAGGQLCDHCKEPIAPDVPQTRRAKEV